MYMYTSMNIYIYISLMYIQFNIHNYTYITVINM